MGYQALYRRYRPARFDDFVGQEAIIKTLRSQVMSGRIAHAYLFCGTRGTGKTSTAKVFARAVNCENPDRGEPCGQCAACRALSAESSLDILEIDAASNNGVDEIRDLREKVKYPPQSGRYRVYIIDEVHMLSQGAFNALLKTLEEPPAYVVFILATTEPQKLPATILSRCQRFDFHRIRVEAIVSRLQVVLEGIGRSAEPEALLEIARAAEGAMRDALSLLDVCLSFTEGAVTAELAWDVLGTTGRDFMFEFADALIAYDAAAALSMIDDAMRRGSDPRVFSLDAANHLRGVLLAEVAGDQLDRILEITPEDAQRFRTQASRANREQLMRAMELFMRVESEMKWATQPRTILELAAVRACHPEQEAESDLRERLDRMEKRIGSGVVAAPAAKVAPVPEKKPDAPKKSAPAAKVSAPAAAPPPEYLAGIERFAAENGSVKRMLEKMQFAGIEDGVVTVAFGKDGIMVRRVLEAKQKLIEAALSESFGTPMRLRMVNEGQAAQAKPSAAAKSVIEQSYDVFGRDKIDLTD